MNCRDFLARHSEYVDDVVDPAIASRMSAHARACSSCARYDRVVRRGGELVRDLLPRVSVSAEYESRMRHRLYHVRDEMTRRRLSPLGSYGALASIVLVAAVAGALTFLGQRASVLEASAAASPIAGSPHAASPVEAQVVWAQAPHRFTPLQPRDVLGMPSQAEPHIAHSAWPVYSRGAAAVAFPATAAELIVRPAAFSHPPARFTAAPVLVHR